MVTKISSLSQAHTAAQNNKYGKAISHSAFVNYIISATTDIIYLYDIAARNVVYSNRNIAEALGFATGDKTNSNSLNQEELLHPDDLPEIEAFQNNLKTSKKGEHREIIYRILDGHDEWRWIHDKSSVFTRDKKGNAVLSIGIARDITVLKTAEDRLRQNQAMLMEKNRLLRELNYELSVEIRGRQKNRQNAL